MSPGNPFILRSVGQILQTAMLEATTSHENIARVRVGFSSCCRRRCCDRIIQ